MQIYLPSTGETVEANEGDWTICFDTMVDGYQPILETDGDNKSHLVTFKSEAEANAEIEDDPEFYEDCFPVPVTDIAHKTIFTEASD